MAVTYSLDEIARTSEDSAVLARFGAVCLMALRVFSIVFLLLGFGHLVESRTLVRAALGGTSFVVALVTLVSVRKKAKNRLAQYVRRHARGVAMVVLLVETACLIIYNSSIGNEAVVAFAVLAPMVAVFFRLLPAEHVLLHAGLASVMITAIVTMGRVRIAPLLAPPLIFNIASLIVALLISRRMKRTIVAEWSERRASAREQIRMRDELRYARELQLSMLPACAPSLPWADICSISVPAAEVGGDYYDYFVEGDRVAIVCGDVAGHGMASGLVLSAFRGGFMVLRESLRDPASVLERLHVVVSETTRRRMLITVSVLLLDSATRRATIASAGHPPVIVRSSDGSVRTVDLFAPPLGVRLPGNVPQREFGFARGDTFVLHTDGIYETRNASDDVYGLDRLLQVVSEKGNGSAEELRDAILADAAVFRGVAEQDDDMTIVVCRVV